MLPASSTLEETTPLAAWARSIERSALQMMLSEASRPGILSLALGLPAPELFPAEAINRAITHVLATDARALQYGPPSGVLKRQVVALMAERGVSCREEQIFITAGAQQGLNMLARLLLDNGSTVLTEQLTYTGFQQAIATHQPLVLSVPTNAREGMDVDAVERLLREGARPACLYTVTDGHNPLGVSLSMEKRERLAALARRFRVPIIEDDPYGFLSYEEGSLPPLRALESEWVYYVGSFSKLLAPALRVGWLCVPEAIMPHLSIIKESSDIDTATLSQRAVAVYLEGDRLGPHLAGLRREYGARRDAMLRALDQYFPAGTRWNNPQSGVFVWVELPDGRDATQLLRAAIETERVAFIPGEAFDVGGKSRVTNCLRLNFSHSSPELIRDGIRRLARVLKS